MLVDRAGQVRRHLVPRDLRIVVRDRRRLDDPGRLDLHLPAAVLVEVPVEPVVVVAHRRDRRNDQPPRPPHPRLRRPRLRVAVGVLPEDAEILLVDADRVPDRPRPPALVRHRAVHVGDLAEAVAAQLQRVGQPPQPAHLARVERVLEILRRARIAVGHHHLRQRRAMADRPQPRLRLPPVRRMPRPRQRVRPRIVPIPDLVQHQPLARVQRRPHLPLLPAQQVPLQRERRPLRLHDVQRLRVLARRAAVIAIEPQRRLRRRPARLVDDLQHPVLDQIDDRHQPLDRPPVAVVLRLVPQVRDPLEDAVPRLPLAAEIAARPRIDLAAVDLRLRDAAPPHRRPPALVRPDRRLRPPELLHQRKRLHVRPRRRRLDDSRLQIDHLGRQTGRRIQRDQLRPPPLVVRTLDRLQPCHQRKPQRLANPQMRRRDLRRPRDLILRKRIQRMHPHPLNNSRRHNAPPSARLPAKIAICKGKRPTCCQYCKPASDSSSEYRVPADRGRSSTGDRQYSRACRRRAPATSVRPAGWMPARAPVKRADPTAESLLQLLDLQ